MPIEQRLAELGVTLPSAPAPAGNYVPAVRVGQLLFLAGAVCVADGRMTHLGKVGAAQTVETAQAGARVCALNLLANAQAALGSLDAVERVVMLTGYVNAIEGFTDSPSVLNGASEVFVAVFGEAGKHARAAVAVSGLPRDSTVEVSAILQVR